ncbi:MAG: hypothetical protein J6X12_00100 [Paludibacteraceae bacterium]|nr:hypothetical protein [Paludibacteraceae bacterium]
MIRKVYTFIFAFILNAFNLFAQEYSTGDVIEKDGISYKVLVTYLVTDPKESPDTITGPDKFYQAGEIMAIKVDENLKDVVIPSAVGRFKVVGLTDSLFYRHEHDRIWLPELNFAGNGCFAKLKMGSGALVIHNIENYGTAVFDELDADLILDITKVLKGAQAINPKGIIKIDTKKLGHVKAHPIYKNCNSATADKYKKWINKAFNDDEEFSKNNATDKNPSLSKKTYTTTPRKEKKGLMITAGATNVKKLGFPWGKLTKEYYRQPKYTVVQKKRRKTYYYQEFTPVADATQEKGWYVKFTGEEGEVKYKLNGRPIK